MSPTSRCIVLVPVGGAIDPGCEDGLRELERRGYPVWRVRGYSAIDAARNQMASGALAQAPTLHKRNQSSYNGRAQAEMPPGIGMSESRPLHRLFGLSWIDFFQGASIGVETELDLSLKQQFLDLVLIRRDAGPLPRPLPDGFADLAAHNLLTFKSHQEALDGWALWELVGHFVNYRKQASPSLQELLPEDDFRLFAVCARYPHNLAQQVALTPLSQGVYEVHALALRIGVIVASQLPLHEHNAMLHLFSAREDLLRYGREHYRPHSPETSTLLYELFKAYSEDPDMPDKLKEFVRQSIDELLASLPVEERLKGLSAEEVVRGLPPETLEALARQLKANGPSPKRKKKGRKKSQD
jgi:hypothetical protein